MSPDAAQLLTAALEALARDEPDAAVVSLRSALAAAPTPLEAKRLALLAVTAQAPALARAALPAVAEQDRAELEALLGGEVSPHEEDAFDVELHDGGADTQTDARIETFLRFFGGRRDLYAEQHSGRHRALWRPVRKPLLPRDVEAHLVGVRTLGQYCLFPDASCSFGVLDLDLVPDARAELRHAPGEPRPSAHPAMVKALRALRDAALTLGLAPALFDSGGKGAHLWLFLEDRRPARAVRTLLNAVLERAGTLPSELAVELFPRQTTHGPKGLSSLVKLPLGIHRGTNRRALMLDDGLAPVLDADDALGRLRTCDEAAVDAVVAHRLVPLPSPELTSPGGAPTPRSEGEVRPSDVAAVLRAVPTADALRAEEAVLGQCAVIAGLVTQAFESSRLSPEEARAIIYTLGLVGPEATLARRVLAAGKANPAALEAARRGLPSPMGCRKLHQLRPELAAACACPARGGPLLYASPVAFAMPGAPTVSAPRARPLEPLPGPLFEDPLATIARSLRRLEARLAERAPDQEPEK